MWDFWIGVPPEVEGACLSEGRQTDKKKETKRQPYFVNSIVADKPEVEGISASPDGPLATSSSLVGVVMALASGGGKNAILSFFNLSTHCDVTFFRFSVRIMALPPITLMLTKLQ